MLVKGGPGCRYSSPCGYGPGKINLNEKTPNCQHNFFCLDNFPMPVSQSDHINIRQTPSAFIRYAVFWTGCSHNAFIGAYSDALSINLLSCVIKVVMLWVHSWLYTQRQCICEIVSQVHWDQTRCILSYRWYLYGYYYILIPISLKFVPEGPVVSMPYWFR